ncbi:MULTISPECIES: F510_1955 family glycosylhydrolase [unclassified Streptomyces]|uniref:F510_1955 family glycosylhydrolase n=1 Tax=unclassified Streptomyces TaxID=2593676 RepID=UPI00370341DA
MIKYRFPRAAAVCAATALTLALTLTACSDPGSKSSDLGSRSSDSGSKGSDPGSKGSGPGSGGSDIGSASPSLSPSTSRSPSALTHIHGLGLHQGALYVATHEGIYSPSPTGPAGAPVLVGDRRDDFMGFTVAPDGTFLASGHPAPGSGGPPDLGLVASADAGRSWTEESLGGEVDFHALDTAPGGPVYGYDSTHGRLRVTRDRTVWEDRARLRALDIAVSPAAPDTVLATTGSGVARSTDGGRTFSPGAGRVLAYVSWGAADALYGVSPDGVLFRSGDGGSAWTEVGTVPGGGPQALTAVDARRLFVATGDGVYESRDAGRSFVRRMEVTSGEDGH